MPPSPPACARMPSIRRVAQASIRRSASVPALACCQQPGRDRLVGRRIGRAKRRTLSLASRGPGTLRMLGSCAGLGLCPLNVNGSSCGRGARIMRAVGRSGRVRCSQLCEERRPIAILPCSLHDHVLFCPPQPLSRPGERSRRYRRGSTATHGPPRPPARSARLSGARQRSLLDLRRARRRADQHQILAGRFSLDGRLEGPRPLPARWTGLLQERRPRRHHRRAATPLEPITRVASGSYEMGFADINALIRYRDQNPSAPVRAVFMVYNRPPYAIVGRKSRGITEPKSSRARSSARRRPAPPSRNGRCSPS